MHKSWIDADWPAPSNIVAGTSTRQNGYSLAPYTSFNLAEHVADQAIHVQKNRQLLQQQLNLPTSPYWLQQTHGTNVVVAQPNSYNQPTADASFSQQTNTICCVLTADCCPILLCDRHGSTVAAIHAGWRGLYAGIIEKTIANMHCENTNLLAWLGPSIGPNAFQVSKDFYTAFTTKNIKTKLAFQQQDSTHWLANLYLLVKQRLQNCNVQHIFGGNYCTFQQQQLFFSYRRDGITGRMASLIYIKQDR